MIEQVERVRDEFREKLASAADAEALEAVRIEFLGRGSTQSLIRSEPFLNAGPHRIGNPGNRRQGSNAAGTHFVVERSETDQVTDFRRVIEILSRYLGESGDH